MFSSSVQLAGRAMMNVYSDGADDRAPQVPAPPITMMTGT